MQEICGGFLKTNILLSIAKEVLEQFNLSDRITAEIQDLEEQINSIEPRLDQVYSDKLAGILDPEDFQRIYANIKAHQKQLMQKRSRLEIQHESPADSEEEAQSFVEKFPQQVFCHREFLVNIIDHIELSAKKDLFLRFRFRAPDLIFQAGNADNG